MATSWSPMRDLDIFYDFDAETPWVSVCYRRFTGRTRCQWTVAGLTVEWPPSVTFERLDGRVTHHTYTDHRQEDN